MWWPTLRSYPKLRYIYSIRRQYLMGPRAMLSATARPLLYLILVLEVTPAPQPFARMLCPIENRTLTKCVLQGIISFDSENVMIDSLRSFGLLYSAPSPRIIYCERPTYPDSGIFQNKRRERRRFTLLSKCVSSGDSRRFT